MIHLFYNKEKDKWSIDLDVHPDLWKEVSNHFRMIGISYAKGKGYSFRGERIFELLLWFERYKWDYSIDPDSFEYIAKNIWHEDHNPTKRRIVNYSTLVEGRKLSPLQKQDVTRLLMRNRSNNFNDSGVGKTACAIFWLLTLFQSGEIDSAIITVPPGLSSQWIYEFLDWSTYFTEDDFGVIDNDTKVKPFDLFKDKKILIIPDHLFADVFASYRKEYKRGIALSKWQWKKYVNVNEAWEKKSIALVIDEAHRFANMQSLKTVALDCHAHYFPFRLFQTATPAITRFEDYYMYLYFTDKSLLGLTKEAFILTLAKETGLTLYKKRLQEEEEKVKQAKRLGFEEKENTIQLKDSKYAIKTYNASAIANYREIISKVSIQRLKKDDPDMKFTLIKRPIHFKMSFLHEKIYEAVAEYYLQRIEQTGETVKLKDINNKFPYLIATLENPELLKGVILNDEVERLLKKWTPHHDERLQFTDTFLEENIGRQNEKVIIFDHRPKTLDMLYERYKKYHPVIDHGAIKRGASKEEYFKQIMTSFNDPNSKCKLALLSELTASAGLNLQKGGNRILFYSVSTASISSRQGQDRQTRFSSTRDSYVYYLLFQKTLDIRNYNRIMGQINLNDDYLSKELSVREIRGILRGMGK